MSSVFFELETLNPNSRTTYFRHKQYTKYIANSEFIIRNSDVEHGLFGKIKEFENIEKIQNVELISKHITNLAENKISIYRGIISLSEYDAERLGYYEQEKWRNLLENKLPSIAEKLNIKYIDLQYVGAVHMEDGHPHLQFMLWSKSKEKSNYFVKYQVKRKIRQEFINDIFKEDLLQIYQEKDLAKKNITSENYVLEELKKISSNEKIIKQLINYEKDFNQSKKIRNLLKDKNVKKVIDLLIDLKQELKNTQGSIKYQYLIKYSKIIEKVDNISNVIINSSLQCQDEIDKYIKAKQKLVEYQYSNVEKLEEAKEKVKSEAEKEIIKLIGNQILDIERKWINSKEKFEYIKYNNESRDLLDKILTVLYYQAQNQKKLNSKYELMFKKQLSKQTKKEIALNKRNGSEFDWEK